MDALNNMDELNMDSDEGGDDHENADDAPFELHHGLIPPYSQYVSHKSALTLFHKKCINNSFGYACNVCDRLWFKNDLKSFTTDQANTILATITNDETKTILAKILVCSGHFNYDMSLLSYIFYKIHIYGFFQKPRNVAEIKICSTCKTSVQKGKVPLLAAENGFKYPEKPAHLPKLNLIAERLISPRLPFMQIRRMRHVNGQFCITGQIINVPVSVDNMVSVLPRSVDDDFCINVHIKKIDS